MTKKPGDTGKIGGIKSTTKTGGVQSTEAVSGIDSVKATSGVGAIKGASAIGSNRLTRTMTLAEREEFLRLVDEEAERLFQHTSLPPSEKMAIKSAVKMAIDSGLIPADDVERETGKKK